MTEAQGLIPIGISAMFLINIKSEHMPHAAAIAGIHDGYEKTQKFVRKDVTPEALAELLLAFGPTYVRVLSG
jgi:hypothetical protein